MQKLNAPFTQSARVLPFVPRMAAPLPAPAKRVETNAEWLCRPRVLDRSARPPVLAPGAALEHDARNTLCMLRMLVSLVNEPDVLSGPYKQAGSDLEHVAGLLDMLVEQLTATSPDEVASKGSIRTLRKIKSSPKPAKTANAALDSCTHLLRAIAGAHVDVYVSAETGLPPLALRDDELLRILTNLVLNASEAMPGGGVVRITARRALSRKVPAVMLRVSDDGPGIPRIALGRVFEPGFTSKQLGPNRSAPGLGLAIVRDLVQRAGGKVEVASTPGRGTTFELRVPCLKVAHVEQPGPQHTSVTGAEWSETLE